MPTNKEIADALQRRIESSGRNRVTIGTVLAWEIVRRLRAKEKTPCK